jgi:hypothetical protein
MSVSTLQLASTSALALLVGAAEAADALHGDVIAVNRSAMSNVSPCASSLELTRTIPKCTVDADDESLSHRLPLNLGWTTKRTAADVLTDLLDVDGIRVVADRHLWDRPDSLGLRHDFDAQRPLHMYFTAGIDRAVYLDSRVLSPSSALSAHRQRSVGMMAEVGAAWRLTGGLQVETDVHWMGLSGDAKLVRTDAGWVSGDPLALTLSLVWRGR